MPLRWRHHSLTPKVAGRHNRLPRPSSITSILGVILALIVALGAIAIWRYYTQ